jgi:hypothetical protein
MITREEYNNHDICIGTITCSPQRLKQNVRLFRTFLDFFKGEIIKEENENMIVFRKPTFDDNKALKTTPDKLAYVFGINSNMPIGVYNVYQELGNEDSLVVYFNDIED